MLPHSIITVGTTERLSPARSPRFQSPPEPRWFDGESPALVSPSRMFTARSSERAAISPPAGARWAVIT